MFTKSFVAFAAALLAAQAVQAQEATPAPEIDRFEPKLTRAEVAAATRQAAREGQIARNDADVERIAAQGFAPQLTRAQVLAELAEARRHGLTVHGEAGAPEATPAQIEAIRQAGLRAAQESVLAARPLPADPQREASFRSVQ